MEASKVHTVSGQFVDLHSDNIFPAEVTFENGIITKITRLKNASPSFILPGFIDAHIHIESSMLIPSQFARLAVTHGTVATVSDPHEIANVLGLDGINFMIDDGMKTPFKFFFGAPSCVPPTSFETSGAKISSDDIAFLMSRNEIKYLAEMMNYPGVLFKDEEVMLKLKHAQNANKPIDGHAPGLMGQQAQDYIGAGISTDHECFTYEEAKHKLDHGMKILIREGSAAKNYKALAPLFNYRPGELMFCSDDKHPDDLIKGHINLLVKRAVSEGYSLFDVLKAACINPVLHYNLEVGQLKIGDPADFIVVKDMKNFEVETTYIKGVKVADSGDCLFEPTKAEAINNFNASPITDKDIAIRAEGKRARIIHALDGEIITKSFISEIKLKDNHVISDVKNDILKLCVINRYSKAKPSVALIHGFGLNHGAIASCVGHDTHNIIAVGNDDGSISRAVNLIIENQGGISAVGKDQEHVLPLPFAGIMSGEDGYFVGKKYGQIDQFVKSNLDCKLSAPFMTLSFMALLVIPELKLSDLGLFDGKSFAFSNLFVD